MERGDPNLKDEMSYQSTFCQMDDYTVGQSSITGRTVKINGYATKFLVDGAQVYKVSPLVQEWVEGTRSPASKKKLPNKAISTAIRAFEYTVSVDDLMCNLDHLMMVGMNWEKSPGQKNYIYGWLLRLWSEGVLAVPREFPFTTKTSLFPTEFMLKSSPWIGEMQSAFRAKDKRSVVGPVFRVAGRSLGIVEPGDLVPETVASNHSTEVANRLAPCMILPLLVLQRTLYGDKRPILKRHGQLAEGRGKLGWTVHSVGQVKKMGQWPIGRRHFPHGSRSNDKG